MMTYIYPCALYRESETNASKSLAETITSNNAWPTRPHLTKFFRRNGEKIFQGALMRIVINWPGES